MSDDNYHRGFRFGWGHLIIVLLAAGGASTCAAIVTYHLTRAPECVERQMDWKALDLIDQLNTCRTNRAMASISNFAQEIKAIQDYNAQAVGSSRTHSSDVVKGIGGDNVHKKKGKRRRNSGKRSSPPKVPPKNGR